MVSVMCDACKKGIPCINMCCPHGQAYEKNPNGCIKVEDGFSYDPVLWDHNDKVFIENWQKEKHFLLVGPRKGTKFECPKDPDGQSEVTVFRGNNSGDLRILMNGKLQKQDVIGVDGTNLTQKETIRWSSDSFCVIYTKAEYFYYEEEMDEFEDWYSRFEFSFVTCHESSDTPTPCTMLIFKLHITCISISTIFLTVTLLVYVFEDSMRKTNPLYSKIMIGFISNLIICFIVLLDNTLQGSEKERRGTISCIISGYMLQYFFLGFLFWINGMSFNIWLKFTGMSMQPPTKENENKKFWKYFLYAQGAPLLIVVITAIVDATAKETSNDENLIHYPNMGKYVCFVGATDTSFKQSFFGRPEFIYFHLIMAIIQFSNIVFLGLTIKSLHAGWRNQAKLHKITEKEKECLLKAKFEKLQEQLTVVLRLFVIMGVPWILDLVATIIAHEYGFDKTCTLRICINTFNLLAGILIFLVIVAKKSVLLSLKEKVTSLKIKKVTSSTSNTKESDLEMK